jgi:hypothetical protein
VQSSGRYGWGVAGLLLLVFYFLNVRHATHELHPGIFFLWPSPWVSRFSICLASVLD